MPVFEAREGNGRYRQYDNDRILINTNAIARHFDSWDLSQPIGIDLHKVDMPMRRRHNHLAIKYTVSFVSYDFF